MLARRARQRRGALNPIKDPSGKLVISEEEIDNTRAGDWAKLYDDKEGDSKNLTKWALANMPKRKIPTEDLNANISEEELQHALTKLENLKSAGSDGVPPELYKTAQPGTQFFGFLLRLMRREWNNGEIDPLWNVAEVVPVPKKGDLQEADN
ncbi:MAG: uncharacterized protein A8A55_2230 [Amphiamblys sp. WSBS2006]|nr:MAG: uncharacterized protein A8A55_2230 [Amphiamblys sp. WSBS2006]